MKTSKGIIGVLTLTLTLLFTGCAKDTPLNDDTEKTRPSLETEAPRQAQGKGTDGTAAEGGSESRNASSTPDLTEDNEDTAPALSEDALARIRSAADEYYASTNYKMLTFSQADPESPYRRPEYEEGYVPGETALFETSIENNRFQHYIAVGSRDGWNHCSVLYEVIPKDPDGEKMNIVKEHVAGAYPELSAAEQAQKAEELYQEKYIGLITPSEIAARQSAAQADRDYVNTAYENSLARDRYVVELISTHSGTETTAEAWEYNLDYLQLHYEELMALEDVNSAFVDLYISIYKAQLWYREYLASISGNGEAEVKIDLGVSSIYPKADMIAAIELIVKEFNTWDGCELHSISYASDEKCSASNVAWLNSLEAANDAEETFTQCIMFLSDYHSPKNSVGAWNRDFEYTDWQWWLARSDNGQWKLMSCGY